MSAGALSDASIVDSWRKNAHAWTAAVRERRIESRTLVTDRAIVDAVLSRSPRRVLDIGCGEGWLGRALAGSGVALLGIDVVPGLIARGERLNTATMARLVSQSAALDASLAAPPPGQACAFLRQESTMLASLNAPALIAQAPALYAGRGAGIASNSAQHPGRRWTGCRRAVRMAVCPCRTVMPHQRRHYGWRRRRARIMPGRPPPRVIPSPFLLQRTNRASGRAWRRCAYIHCAARPARRRPAPRAELKLARFSSARHRGLLGGSHRALGAVESRKMPGRCRTAR